MRGGASAVRWSGRAAAVVVPMAGIFAGPGEALPLRLSALLCVIAIVVQRVGNPRWTTVAAVTASLATTLWLRLTHPVDVTDPAGEAYRVLLWSALESAAMAVLIVPVVRAAPPREAAALGLAAGLAESAVALRLAPAQGLLVQAFTVTWWSLAAACAAGLGLYLRTLDQRRGRAVEAARREQRMELACDLHDFVAHDLTGIVVQAQAAQVVADPAKGRAALAWIEEAGLQALSVTDRTVRLLSAGGDAERHPVPGLADLPELVRRFTADPGDLRLRMEVDAEDVPREIGATAYRIVVEALTNVRRHAPASTVVIVVDRTGEELHVRVTNDGVGDGTHVPAARRGGLGLVGLRERVGALGGTLEAGPHRAGWRVAAALPLAAR
ncbi:two-component sensor histidine kinase [Actinomadura barringtoniae]|uniref:histidine kinase n=1 Tax=Actinomadura barringtoniae TaxID=1427535 RepID=A0A939PIQ7_9ACTN|nr:histidine kinase [Actinomadura barringtoniae]MBO2453461.1 two-component sensor histidine kinase [Actinomadura barringtoniae]